MPWYPHYSGSTSGQSVVNQPTGGGMYSYAPGAQSVFGGEFGPARNSHYPHQQHPFQHLQHPQHPQHPQAQSHYAQSSYAQSAYGYEGGGGGSTYEMSPPRPGYMRGHGRTGSSSSQLGGGRRQSSYSSYGGEGGRDGERERERGERDGGRAGARDGRDGRPESQWDDAPTPRKNRQSSFGPGHLVN